ncbi:hypothetical protein BDV26DRAFT_119034 [Aspergillus bertholletiae]|uniref:Uncharacterized protein n=1 Tax=Aspergillus bertholletiae TaxID=1226010 RepID=A0A5N7BG92_9EURO|nr:hypothetical protein BDV26DRAFT_119034 [Aspergillus bertholletiae]
MSVNGPQVMLSFSSVRRGVSCHIGRSYNKPCCCPWNWSMTGVPHICDYFQVNTQMISLLSFFWARQNYIFVDRDTEREYYSALSAPPYYAVLLGGLLYLSIFLLFGFNARHGYPLVNFEANNGTILLWQIYLPIRPCFHY